MYFWISCVYLGYCRFALSVPQPSDWLERLLPEMTYYVLSGMLNSTHSLTNICVCINGGSSAAAADDDDDADVAVPVCVYV